MNKTNENGITRRSHINVTPRFADRQTRQGVYELIKPQAGRSMIEMLGVLAIIGVLSVGGIMGYSKAMMRYKINKTIEQITYIAGNMRTTFANQGNYTDCCSYNVLKKAHIVPDEMWKDGNLKHEWNDDIDMNSNSDMLGGGFLMEFYNIPEEACIEILTKDLNIADVFVDNDDGMAFVPPLQLGEAQQLCSYLLDEGIDMVTGLYFRFDANIEKYRQHFL